MSIKSESFLQAISGSLLWNSSSRLINISKQIFLASAIGLTVGMDIFFLTISFLGLFVFSWGHVLNTATIPRLVELKKNKRVVELNLLVSQVWSLSLLISILISLLLFILAPMIAELAFGLDDSKIKLLESSLVLLSPIALFYIPVRFLLSVMKANRQFIVTSIVDFFNEVIIMILIVIFIYEPNILLLSFLCGAIAQSLLVIVLFSRNNRLIFGNPFSKEVINVIKKFGFLFIASSAGFLYVLTDRFFAAYLPTGSISGLAYAMGIVTLLPGVLNLSGPILTIFSETYENAKEISKKLNEYISLVIFIGLPIAIFISIFSSEIISIIFERGEFDGSSVELVSMALFGYMPMIIPLLLINTFDHIFFLKNRILFLTQRLVVGLIANVILNSLFIFTFEWGVFGLALASSLSYILMVLFGIMQVKKLNILINYYEHFLWFTWIIVASVCFAYFFLYIYYWIEIWWIIFPIFPIFIVMIILIGLLYRGHENKLIKSILIRIGVTK